MVLQPITGAALVWLVGYSFLEGWILLSLLLYAVTELFWLPVVRIQTRMRDLAMASVKHASAIAGRISPSFRRWFAFGFPAFASVLAIFWLMIARPRISDSVKLTEP